MARRPNRDEPDVLNQDDLKQIRRNLALLSPSAVRDFYQRAFEDCRLIYDRLPSPRKIQTLVQARGNHYCKERQESGHYS
jgi:hypothetical protein